MTAPDTGIVMQLIADLYCYIILHMLTSGIILM